MKFVSTRGATNAVTLSDAIVRGIAADGGLFVPERIPALSWSRWPAAVPLSSLAELLIAPFADGDPLAPELAAVCREAFNFPAPLVRLERAQGHASVLELFHGPTCAFKDFGARFLAAALARLHAPTGRKVTILVATSGDTGGAVAAAFHRRPHIDVVLLYPNGLVSPRQAQQLAWWGENVRTFAVHGTFDDCQRMVKDAFRDPVLTASHHLSSANSINVGRLLPQMVYYASASLEIWNRDGRKASFIVPSGNLGNVTACTWAREAGLPIDDIVLATNENRTVTEFLESGAWHPRPSVATLASAMDVGNPSNIERLRALFPDRLGDHISAHLVTDDQIRATIREDYDALGYVWDPHGATAAYVHHHLSTDRLRNPWVLVGTAHPAKFNEIVEPLIGHEIPVPPALARLLSMPRQEEDLEPTIDALREKLVTRAERSSTKPTDL
jgi:threonine synthase